MAIIFLQEKRTQKSLIAVFVLVILAIAFVLWQGFSEKETEVYVEEEVGLEFIPRKIEIDFSLLESSVLESLQLFSEIEPLEEATPTEEEIGLPTEIGRENPFIPY
jgi:hypothetical protein